MKTTFLTILCALFMWSSTAFAQSSGNLDENFGSDGISYLNFETDTNEYLMDMICLKNDKIIVAGYFGHYDGFDVLIARLNKNGSVDYGFGDNGYVSIDFEGTGSQVGALTELSDGKLLVVGSCYDFDLSIRKGFIMRLNSNGSIDQSFGEGGKGYTFFNAGNNKYCMATDLETYGGSIFVSATVSSEANNLDFGIFKFTWGGILSQSFASNGSNLIDITPNDNVLNLDINSKGEFILGGVTYANSKQYGTVVKLNFYGLLDAQFNGKGWYSYDQGSGLNTIIDVAFDSKDRIVAAGSEGLNPDKNAMVIRFKTNGQLDSTFSDDGMQSSDIGLTNGVYINTLLIEPDNSVCAVGYLFGDNYSDIYVLKLDESGDAHAGFGSGGDVNHPVPFDPSYIYFKSADFQSNGDLVMAATTTIKDMDVFSIIVAKVLNTQDSVSTIGIATHNSTPVSIYPNPASSFFKLEMGELNPDELLLIDLEGKVVCTWEGPQSTYFLPAQLTPGTYVLEIRVDDRVLVSRIILL